MNSDADFTPNPDRAIWIEGEINQALESRLRPLILELTSCSRDPITVFIDSNGGTAAVGERILELLRSTKQDGAGACRIITVALSKAKSTAADILSAGDFAIAGHQSKLLYHGIRVPMPEAITGECATLLAGVLTASDRRFAESLLDKSADRFMFLLLGLRSTFEEYRANERGRTLTDLDCFEEILVRKVSPSAKKVLRSAATFWMGRCDLVTRFEDEVARAANCGQATDIEGIMLEASVAFERQENKTEWNLRTGGLSRINDHFFFLDAYIRGTNGVKFAAFCERWADHVLAKDEQRILSDEEKAYKFRVYFLPFWSFFVALCHALQRAENELTAMDAFWLGLIDTVR